MDYLINSEQVTDICDAIRERSETSQTYNFLEIPDAIRSIPGGPGPGPTTGFNEDCISFSFDSDYTRVHIGNNITNISGYFASMNNSYGPTANGLLYKKMLFDEKSGKGLIDMSSAFKMGNISVFNYGTCIRPTAATNMNSSYYMCNSITKSYVPDTVTDLTDAYRQCYNLEGSVMSPNSVLYMNRAYNGCNKITKGAIGTSVIQAQYSYMGCSNLESADVYSTKANLYSAFDNCKHLNKINMYGSVSVVRDLSYIFKNIDNGISDEMRGTPLIIEMNPIKSKTVYDFIRTDINNLTGSYKLGYINNKGSGPDGLAYWERDYMYEGVACDYLHSSCRDMIVKPNYEM